MSGRLDELALKHGTGKSSQGLHYTPAYEQLLGPLRERKLRLLEIGVATGASLRMWEEYFPHAEIFAIEKDPAGRRHESSRSRVFIGDQSDRAFLREVIAEIGPLDLVIDDGSHHPDHVLVSLEALFPALRDGGIYVIEDLGCSFSPRFGAAAGLGNPASAIEWLKGLLDVIHASPPFGGRIGGPIESRVRAIHFFPQIAFLVKGAAGEGAGGADDRRSAAAPRRPWIPALRSALRHTLYRLQRAARRVRRRARKLTRDA